MTPPQSTPADQGNPLLGGTPANLTTSLMSTPIGQRMALTVRTASTTLTVFLDRKDAQAWTAQISGMAGQMSGLIAAAPGIPVNGNGPAGVA